MERYKIYKNSSSLTPTVYVNKNPFAWLLAFLIIAFVTYVFFFADNSKHIVCNKSKNICSVYANSIVDKNYKLKDEFDMSEIRGIYHSLYIRKVRMGSSHRYRYKNEYKIYIKTTNKSIPVATLSTESSADRLVQNLEERLKNSSANSDFVLYQKN